MGDTIKVSTDSQNFRAGREHISSLLLELICWRRRRRRGTTMTTRRRRRRRRNNERKKTKENSLTIKWHYVHIYQ